MYKVIDTYEDFEELIGTFGTLNEAKAAAHQHCIDTDGECRITIFEKREKGYKVII